MAPTLLAKLLQTKREFINFSVILLLLVWRMWGRCGWRPTVLYRSFAPCSLNHARTLEWSNQIFRIPHVPIQVKDALTCIKWVLTLDCIILQIHWCTHTLTRTHFSMHLFACIFYFLCHCWSLLGSNWQQHGRLFIYFSCVFGLAYSSVFTPALPPLPLVLTLLCLMHLSLLLRRHTTDRNFN